MKDILATEKREMIIIEATRDGEASICLGYHTGKPLAADTNDLLHTTREIEAVNSPSPVYQK